MIQVRNPNSTRPYQHVLEPVIFYLYIAMKQYNNKELAGTYNIGPDEIDCVTTGDIVSLFCNTWKENAHWVATDYNGPHEANFLKLDCSKLKKVFGWEPKWDLELAIEKVVEWNKCWLLDGDIRECMDKQISEFLK